MANFRHSFSAYRISARAILLFAFFNLILLYFLISLCRTYLEPSKWPFDDTSFDFFAQPDKAEPLIAAAATKEAITRTATTTLFTTITATATTTKQVVVTSTVTPTPKIPGPPFCDACGPHDTLCTEYGKHNLAKSRLYEGTNFRFHRVIKQALAGEPVKIGILGGSVTRGHGLRSVSDNWTARFLEACKALFPNSLIELTNGAVAATGSDYLSVCFGEHLDPDVDLVIVELAINDQRTEANAHAYEWLIRGLLDMPKRPAVINLQTMALLFEQISMGGDLHIPTAQYYDVPTLSIRNFLVPHILNNAELDEYYFCETKEGPDWRHVDTHGHKVMADILIAYTQRQVCAVESEGLRHANKDVALEFDSKLPKIEELDELPRIRLLQKYDRQTVLKAFTPYCQSVRTTKHPLTPIQNQGWTIWTYTGRGDKPYLIAKNPGDYVKFEIIVGIMGRVRITFLKSKTFGLGTVLCWLDEERSKGKKISGWWDKENLNIARVEIISDKADPGKHTLTCEILQETSDPGGGHEFRIIAIDAS